MGMAVEDGGEPGVSALGPATSLRREADEVERAGRKGEGPGLNPPSLRGVRIGERARRVEEWSRTTAMSSRSVKGAQRVGRSIRSLWGLRRSACILRVLRGGGGVLPDVRGGASPREESGPQPDVVTDAAGAGLEPASPGAIPRGSESRNGRDVVGSNGRFDTALAVALHVGADAREGEHWQ